MAVRAALNLRSDQHDKQRESGISNRLADQQTPTPQSGLCSASIRCGNCGNAIGA